MCAEARTRCTAPHLTGTGSVYALARIAEEVHAPDRAAQGAGDGESQDVGLEENEEDTIESSRPLPAHAQVHALLRCA